MALTTLRLYVCRTTRRGSVPPNSAMQPTGPRAARVAPRLIAYPLGGRSVVPGGA
jgi:hypothetical protein